MACVTLIRIDAVQSFGRRHFWRIAVQRGNVTTLTTIRKEA